MSTSKNKKSAPAHRLSELDKLYNKHKSSLSKTGYIFPGSIVRRFVPCGKQTCRCATSVTLRHGPYYEWTRKLRGKTVTVRLSPLQAGRFGKWIQNDRQLKKTLNRMRSITVRIAKIS